MTDLRSKYLKTVRRRLSEVALQRGDSVIERPAVVRSDIRALPQALNDAESEAKNATIQHTESRVEFEDDTENGQSVGAP